MNIKTISELLNRHGLVEMENEEVSELIKLLSESARQSENIILHSVSEKDFVGMCRMVKFTVMSIMLANGEGQALALADKMGELDGLLDTYVLSVIGLLIREEIV
jgi:hypothetical protein